MESGTGYAIVRRYRENGVAANKHGGPSNKKVDEEMAVTVVQIVEEIFHNM